MESFFIRRGFLLEQILVTTSFHTRSNDLADSIAKCPVEPWTGKFVRSTGIDYANRRDLITGVGSQTFGGRYNPIGIRAVYGSLDLNTAIAEYTAHARRQGLPETEMDIFPLVSVSLAVDLQRLLNLTDARLRKIMKITYQEITEESWQDLQDQGQEALTQAIGRLARAAGFEGLLFPSAANKPKGKNLVLFPDMLPKGNLRIIHKEKLPAPRRKKP